MKKMTIITLCVTALALTACNTIQGAGEDIKDAGNGISSTAQKVKEKIEK